VANTGRLAERLEFTLANLGYRFPDHPVPAGESQDSYLKKMTYFGAQQRYGSVVGDVRRQLERELALIAKLGFSGYFLIVWDLCAFARDRGIAGPGAGERGQQRGLLRPRDHGRRPDREQAALRAVPLEGRTDWPDIDLDLPSGDRREELIQEVYRRYGRRGAAMTANVITYRGRSTIREVGKVLGFPDDALDRFSSLYHGGDLPQTLELGSSCAWRGCPTRTRGSRAHRHLPAGSEACRGTSGSTRAGWSSARRAWTSSCRSRTRGCRGAASCSGTRTTSRTWGSSRWTCSGSA
jgi:error-prone DNA polymerase